MFKDISFRSDSFAFCPAERVSGSSWHQHKGKSKAVSHRHKISPPSSCAIDTFHFSPASPRLLRMVTRLLSFIRSWTGKETMTRTSSRPPTLGFVRPSSWMRRRTPLCLPEHSRTKPSTCTGSRRNARRAARVCQRAARRGSNGRSRRQRLEEVLHLCRSPVCTEASCDPAYYF